MTINKAVILQSVGVNKQINFKKVTTVSNVFAWSDCLVASMNNIMRSFSLEQASLQTELPLIIA